MKQKTQVDLQPMKDFLRAQINQARHLERTDTELLIRMVQGALRDVEDTLDRDTSSRPHAYTLDDWSAQVLSREVDRLQTIKRKLEGVLEVCE